MTTGRGDDQQALELDLDSGSAPGPDRDPPAAGSVVRVLPDVSGLDRTFDYAVPDSMADRVAVGTMVRVELHGRRVGGWVVETGVVPTPGVRLLQIAKVSGVGPPADLVELASWAAHRWAGRWGRVLVAASPPTMVTELPPPRPAPPAPGPLDALAAEAFSSPRVVVRLPPAGDVFPFALAACARGHALIVAPTLERARHLALRLRRAGVPVGLAPRDWAMGAAGRTMVGARSAAWAPVRELAAVLVVDEHDESLQEERVPTWHARDVLVERARRAGVPCVLTSPAPSLEALELAPLTTVSRRDEREGWPILDVIDRRGEEPGRAGLYAERLVPLLRGDGPLVCVLNRTGRSRLLACDQCGELAVCETCGRPMVSIEGNALSCVTGDETRPSVCVACGATRLKNLRAGVSRAREELEALAGRSVVEVTASSPRPGALDDRSIVVGTEAVLHAVERAHVVAFLDFDQELLAPRMRASEQALALLVRAARLVGPRSTGGRVVVQTRQPRHEVLDAVLHADAGRLVESERVRRRMLALPPYVAMAEISGAAAEAFVAGLAGGSDLSLLGPNEGRWLLKAPHHDRLAEVLAAAPRPPGRLRLAVDPLRV